MKKRAIYYTIFIIIMLFTACSRKTSNLVVNTEENFELETDITDLTEIKLI